MLDLADAAEIVDRRYRVVRSLGTGATGQVVLAEDLEANSSLVALKFLYPHLVQSEEAFARFLTETRVTMRLSQRNILTVYGFGRDQEHRCYLKMEYLEGDSLDHLLSEAEPIELRTLIGMLLEIANALQYAHAHGVIHRDLKPANILVTKSGSVRVLDFGLAQVIRSDIRVTNQGAIVGTPHYMAPEQFRGEQLDNRADIYAFGVIAFEMLTGQKPFAAETLWELAEQHLHSAVPDVSSLNADCPKWLAELVRQIMSKNREDRPKSMQEVLHQFAEAGFAETELQADLSNPPAELSYSSERYLLGRRLGTGVRMLLGITVLVVLLVLPRTNGSTEVKYSTWVFSLERKIGAELHLLRSVLGVVTDVQWPEAFLDPGEKSTPRVRLALVRAGYALDIRNPVRGTNPLHEAITQGNPELVEEFARHRVLLDQRDHLGQTPLQLAALHFQPAYEAILLNHGADPNIGNLQGVTPLHLAIKRQESRLARELLGAGADPNSLDSHRETPLHIAARAAQAELLKMLIAAGGDPDQVNLSNQTPRQLAADAGIHINDQKSPKLFSPARN